MELVCSSELSRSVPAKRDLASVAESQAAEFAAAAAGSLVWLISAMLYLSSEIGLWVVGSEVFIGYDSFQTFNYWLASRLWGLQVVFKLTFDMDSMVCSRLPTTPGKNKAKAVPAFENKDDDDSDDDEEDEEEGDDEDDDGGEEDASGDEGDNKKVEDGGDGEDAPANGEGGSEDEDDDDDEGGDDEEDEDDDGEDDEDEEEEDEDDDEDPEPPAKKRK